MVPLAALLCRGTLASLNRLRLHARWGKEEEVEEEEMEAEKLAVGALRLLRWLQATLGGGRTGPESPGHPYPRLPMYSRRAPCAFASRPGLNMNIRVACSP